MVKKIILYTLTGIFALVVLSLILLPFVVPPIVENNSKDWIGRSVALDKMRLNYFTGTLRLYDFKLFEKDDETVFVKFDTLLVDTEPYRLFNKTFVVEQFFLKGLFADVIMYDSAFNFDDLLELGNDTTDDEESMSNKNPIKFDLSNLEVKDAVFILQDAEINDSIEIDQFDVFLPHIAWDQSELSEADLEFTFKDGGYLNSIIDYNPDNGSFMVDLKLNDYDISGYQEFVDKYVDIGKFEGIVDLNVGLKGNMASPLQTKMESKFVMSDFAIYDEKDSVMVGTRRIDLKVDEADLANKTILIDSIHVFKPTVYFEAYDSTSNIAEFMKHILPPEDSVQGGQVPDEVVSQDTAQQDSEEDTEILQKDTTRQFYLSINSILLDSGKVDVADYSHERKFEYQISELLVTTDSITSEATWVNLNMSMTLGDHGKMVADYAIDLSNPEVSSLDMTVSSLMLDDFDVYCREATGYPLMYGDMYLKSHTNVHGDSLKGENNIIIHNMKLGRREKVIGPPLKMAMFLLKDKDKVIHFDMPMAGSMGESAADIGKLIWNTFSSLIFKVVSTPFKFLGATFNILDTDIKRINFDYLDTAFTNKEQRQLNALLKIEDHDEEVKIDLVYYKDSLLEREQLAMDMIEKEFGADKGGNGKYKRNARFRDYVESRVHSDTLSLEEACLLLADHHLVDSLSALYDSARFRSLRGYLISQRDTTDIRLYQSRETAPKNEDVKPHFEVKLGMKDEFIEENYIDKKNN